MILHHTFRRGIARISFTLIYAKNQLKRHWQNCHLGISERAIKKTYRNILKGLCFNLSIWRLLKILLFTVLTRRLFCESIPKHLFSCKRKLLANLHYVMSHRKRQWKKSHYKNVIINQNRLINKCVSHVLIQLDYKKVDFKFKKSHLIYPSMIFEFILNFMKDLRLLNVSIHKIFDNS